MPRQINENECLVEGQEGSGQHYDHQLKQINFLDHRVYERSKDLYYPSVTQILTACPPDPFFLDWLKQLGANAEIIRDKAAREGSTVHQCAEQLVAGKVLDWKDEYGNARYSLRVWQMILKVADFLNTYKPEVLASELFLYSDEYQYAGTTDLLCKIDGQTWLLDWKTSNHCSKSYDMQLAAYANALEETRDIHVDRAGIVWLKAATRGPRKGAMQGKGWQVLEVEDIEKDFEAFLKIYDVYKIYNPKIEPLVQSYPTEVKLDYL